MEYEKSDDIIFMKHGLYLLSSKFGRTAVCKAAQYATFWAQFVVTEFGKLPATLRTEN